MDTTRANRNCIQGPARQWLLQGKKVMVNSDRCKQTWLWADLTWKPTLGRLCRQGGLPEATGVCRAQRGRACGQQASLESVVLTSPELLTPQASADTQDGTIDKDQLPWMPAGRVFMPWRPSLSSSYLLLSCRENAEILLFLLILLEAQKDTDFISKVLLTHIWLWWSHVFPKHRHVFKTPRLCAVTRLISIQCLPMEYTRVAPAFLSHVGLFSFSAVWPPWLLASAPCFACLNTVIQPSFSSHTYFLVMHITDVCRPVCCKLI